MKEPARVLATATRDMVDYPVPLESFRRYALYENEKPLKGFNRIKNQMLTKGYRVEEDVLPKKLKSGLKRWERIELTFIPLTKPL